MQIAGRFEVVVVRLTPGNVATLKKFLGAVNIKMTVVDAEGEISRLLHLWSAAEQGSGRVLLERRFVDVQKLAKMQWDLSSVPSLEHMVRHIECLGGTEITPTGEYEDIYAGLDAAAARWIYLVLSGSIAFSSNMGQQYDEPKCACVCACGMRFAKVYQRNGHKW